MLKSGQVFNNRYKIISTLGQGGFGAVYKAWDDNLQRHCAIKENLQVSPEAQKQFKREAIMLANLNHPHLVRVTDYFFVADRGQYLVMDFVDGNDLHTILTDNGGPLPTEQALAWIRQVCDALIYIHGQNPPIIHRDIKPANIRVTPQGNAVLVDFGLAKTFDVGTKTSMGARGLTPHFAAPEQYGMGGTDAQSDIYSLGVTLYCLLTYSVPPDSVEIMVGNTDPPSPAKVIRGNISDSVSDALQRAMQIRRTERYKSVTDFKNALSASQAVQILSPAYKTPANIDRSSDIQLLSSADLMGKNINMYKNNDPSKKAIYSEDFLVDSIEYAQALVHSAIKHNQTIYIVVPKVITPIPNKISLFNGMEFMRVPAGKFLMGSTDDEYYDEKPQHTVELSEYLIGKHPVTNLEYQAFVRDAKYKEPEDWENDQFPTKKSNHPVVNVSWDDAIAYCKWLSQKTGKQHRLPTEAEWEKAARGIDGRVYPWGDVFDLKKANTSESINGTTDVGSFSPEGDSPYGCADMAGNVWEWCNDWHSNTYYKSSPSSDPLGPDSGQHRVLRGGSWGIDDNNLVRSAYRYGDVPSRTYFKYSFRCASSLPLLEHSSPKPVQVVVSTVIKIDKSCSQNNLTYDNKITLSNGMEFMHVPAGEFLMGSDNGGDGDKERPLHKVIIPYDYWMASYTVTNELYNIYVKSKGINHPVLEWEEKIDHPVTEVDWTSAIAYCQWLNKRVNNEMPLGLTIRLPTEAEWEKAARGERGNEFPWGYEFDGRKCNVRENKREDTTSVGLYSPEGDSPYGCSDMAGNVLEWTHSLYINYPYKINDGREDYNLSDTRVLRGGSFMHFGRFSRCAYRYDYSIKASISNVGFRIVLAPPFRLN